MTAATTGGVMTLDTAYAIECGDAPGPQTIRWMLGCRGIDDLDAHLDRLNRAVMPGGDAGPHHEPVIVRPVLLVSWTPPEVRERANWRGLVGAFCIGLVFWGVLAFVAARAL